MTTFVSLLLDETGSMENIKDDTIGGVNSYVDGLRREIEGDCKFTLVKFDSSHQTAMCTGVNLDSVPRLTLENYRPGAMTPLIDATWNIVKKTEEVIGEATLDKHNVTIVVQTDGMENRSREHTRADLNELITQKQKDGWVFVFIGAGIDAFAEAGQYGFKAASTMSYGRGRTKQTFDSMVGNTVAYASSGVSASMNFSDQQRDLSGEDEILGGSGGRSKKRKAKDNVDGTVGAVGDGGSAG